METENAQVNYLIALDEMLCKDQLYLTVLWSENNENNTIAKSKPKPAVLYQHAFITARPSLSFNDAIPTISVSYYTVKQED